MHVRALTEADFEAVHAATLDAFADYPVPMQPPRDVHVTMLARRGVVWPLSVGAFEGPEVLGFWLSARTGSRAYDVMTGVRRSAQGRGLVRELFDGLVPMLAAAGIETVTLEVITTNLRAVRAYERLGFERVRRLVCVRWADRISGRDPDRQDIPGVGADLTIVEAELDWDRWAPWCAWQPAWPSGRETVERSEPRLVLEARRGDRSCGFLVACCADLLQLAVDPAQRRTGVGTALLAEWSQRQAGPLRVLNVDSRANDALGLFATTAAEPFLDQWEMARVQSKSTEQQ